MFKQYYNTFYNRPSMGKYLELVRKSFRATGRNIIFLFPDLLFQYIDLISEYIDLISEYIDLLSQYIEIINGAFPWDGHGVNNAYHRRLYVSVLSSRI